MRNTSQCIVAIRHVLSLVVCLVVAILPAPAAGQSVNRTSGTAAIPPDSTGPWEVDFHAGGTARWDARAGTVALPAPSIFTNQFNDRFPQMPSWYFGDGAQLLNTVMALEGLTERIIPLDHVLNGPIAAVDSGRTFGFRVGRRLTPRIQAEFSLDALATTRDIPSEVRAAVEASRASFVVTWRSLHENGDATRIRVDATASPSGPIASHDVLTTAVANLTVLERGRTSAYLGLDGGFESTRGEDPQIVLTGTYAFRLDGFPFSETDKVVARQVDDGGFVGVIGLGARRHISRHAALRVDMRAYVGAHRVRTIVDATPSFVIGPGLEAVTPTNPHIQWVNNVGGDPTTLSGRATNFATFSGTGVSWRIVVSGGFFWHF